MVEKQLLARDIRDARACAVFSSIERHRFVPQEFQENAYADSPLSIGYGQTVSQPYIVALMAQALRLLGSENILEIGTGSGYQSAVLAGLARHVYTVERIEPLAARAHEALKACGVTNVTGKVADGTLGWQEYAPFDRIIVSAAFPKVPPPLLDQLKDPGVLVMPLGDSFSQVLTVVEKQSGRMEIRQLCGCVFVPLVGLYAYRQEP